MRASMGRPRASQRRSGGAGPEAGGGAGAPPGPQGPSPWQDANTVSKASDLRVSRSDDRWDLLQVLWNVSSMERLRSCRRRLLGDELAIKNNGEAAYYSGAETCGSIHACPCCQANIRNARADHVAAAAAKWDRMGNTILMATFTPRHHKGLRLEDGLAGQGLYSLVTQSFRKILGGNRWYRMKRLAKVAFMVRALEVTEGKNGWHPHLHVLFFIEGDLGAEGLARFTRYLKDTWAAEIVKAGFDAPSEAHGVTVEICRSAEEAGQYIAKTQEGKHVGNEMTRQDLKTARDEHRTPLQILRDFRDTGDKADLALWYEYERASKGRKAITGLSHIYKLLGDDVVEQSDEALAAAEVGGDEVARLSKDVWRAVTEVRHGPSSLLRAAERGGRRGVELALEAMGIMVPPGSLEPPAGDGTPVSDRYVWLQRARKGDLLLSATVCTGQIFTSSEDSRVFALAWGNLVERARKYRTPMDHVSLHAETHEAGISLRVRKYHWLLTVVGDCRASRSQRGARRSVLYRVGGQDRTPLTGAQLSMSGNNIRVLACDDPPRVIETSDERDIWLRRVYAAGYDGYLAGYADGERNGYAAGTRDLEVSWQPIAQAVRDRAGAPTHAELLERRWGPGGRRGFSSPRASDRFPRRAVAS